MVVMFKEGFPQFQNTVFDCSGVEGIEYPKCYKCRQPFRPILCRFTREGERVCPTCFLRIGLIEGKERKRIKKKNGVLVKNKISQTRSFLPLPLITSGIPEHIKIAMRESNG